MLPTFFGKKFRHTARIVRSALSFPAPMVTATKKRILVVEDEQDTAAMIARFLGDEFDTVVATNGVDGLALAQQEPLPDLVIVDIMMPKLDGVSMTKRLREHEPMRRVPIIFLTAKSDPMDVIAGIQAGARHYITKPFVLDDLKKKVRKAVYGR
ncbi:response regulator [Sorangium sp. So ce327]|uniref:response regulator transcription factor n=1 Tax=unclassified Sorangium TaxID=2621164 RepID=UPI003F5DF253